ncbi:MULTISPECIES: hypothetical protein [Bradyrhizobium]|uniref:hypothetical protein n=1 Tax=Bradyrhizobium sp. BR2003 TaxID=1419258 RepID=UPI001484CFFD|nr:MULTISPECIES: hypothetical protein [Bradyrhizobium]
MQGFLLQVEVSKIIVHEACEPNAVIDFLAAELAGQHGGDVDPLAVQAKRPTLDGARESIRANPGRPNLHREDQRPMLYRTRQRRPSGQGSSMQSEKLA